MRLFSIRAFSLGAVVLLVGMATGCPQKNEDPAVTRGKQAYMGTCIACHNMNPALDGSVGPAIQGASKEVLEAKIMRGEYPAGYKAKRETKIMPPQPQLAANIDDLAAFLATK